MDYPKVALVGQMNAGKSTLFNRLAGERLAVTSDVPGTTRDRQYALITWEKRKFYIVDTAGLSFSVDKHDTLEKNVLKQIQTAKKEADILVMVVDGKVGVQGVDRQVLLEFRKAKQPVILAINKLDGFKEHESSKEAFQKLGIKTIVPLSSVSGRGTGNLMDEIVKKLPKTKPATRQSTEAKAKAGSSIHIAIVGKPNAGKSSIFNKILNDERVVVSETPGTTRTAIDSEIEIAGTNYTFIDTAGLKRKARNQPQPDVFSSFQVFKSIRKSDVCFLVIDAYEPLTHQDLAIAQAIKEQQKGCVIIANKVDKFTNFRKKESKHDKSLAEKIEKDVLAVFPFLKGSPVFLSSAVTGEGLGGAIEAAKEIYNIRLKETHQDDLNRLLAYRMKNFPPQLLKDQKKPKVFGLNQIGTNPPAFELIVNTPSAVSQAFIRGMENAIIKTLGYEGTPIKLLVKKKI